VDRLPHLGVAMKGVFCRARVVRGGQARPRRAAMFSRQ
jgi:hypothetical protein